MRTYIARSLLTLVYAGVLVLVCLLAWKIQKVEQSDLSKTFGVLASAFLGATVNPPQKKEDAQVSSLPPDPLWLVAAFLAAPAVVITGVALAVHGCHPNAATAFAAAIAAFAALFVDTNPITHPQGAK